MADEPQPQPQQPTTHTLRGIHWRDVFPFTHLFRAFRIAVHPSKLILGLLALLLLYLGGVVLDALWLNRYLALPNEAAAYQRYALTADRRVAQPFGELMAQQRQAIQERYADELLEQRVVDGMTRDQALQAARGGDYAGVLKGKIAYRRNEALRAAAQRRDEALRAADAVQQTDVRESQRRDARIAYERAVAEAYQQEARERLELESIRHRGIFGSFFDYESRQINGVVSGVLGNNWLGGLSTRLGPPRVGPEGAAEGPGVVQSVINFLVIGPSWLITAHPWYFVLYAVWFLIVWAVFGGAVARIAAVHVARDEKISVRQALKFSVSKLLSFAFAPLIPLIIVLFVGLLLSAAGLLFYVPVIGPIIAGLFFILALVAGVVMALVLLGTIGGFNLMYPTIAVEGSDSFDAISRSFSYVFARPWRMLFYTAVAVVYGALTYLFVRFFVWLILAVTHSAVGFWLYGEPGTYYPQMWPKPAFSDLPYDINYTDLAWSEDAAAGLISFWVYLVVSLLGAFAISFYFSANTIIYYLMRREVDATELDDVYVEEIDEDFGETAPVTPGEAIATSGPDKSAATAPAASTAGAAPAMDTTDAPGGGVSGTAGSAAPGGGAGTVRVYNTPSADAPPNAGGDNPDPEQRPVT